MAQFVDNYNLALERPVFPNPIHKLKFNSAHFAHILAENESPDKQFFKVSKGLCKPGSRTRLVETEERSNQG